ncbi:hypothetical protein [Acetilactobacillus jinshanensis]|uniref:Uncharacterized protein n=1 Tax=Acetilactobacillus jinshanensis TaxID=1720083 RepID=A0A4P6ZJX4_9LACO|nr:hypothetical protein [Acetilactobacillus jinshanensis]QBP17807.1 hypothetical protein ELX58_01180 [Acetilactobacillus jinshanensis]URL60669.1 hypothetical protein HGK75_01210 [uncultured bacterium]
MSKLVKFDQLSDQAKKKAILDFAKFYVPHYRSENLEIIGSYDHTGLIWDINRDIWDNKFNSKEDVIKMSAHDRPKHYGKLLDKMDQKFYENGNPEKPWKKWYHDKYFSIETGL